MSGNTNTVSSAPSAPDRRATRRSATTAEIIAAAWDLARERGLAGVSMRDLGDRVGMRAQSVYSYFASKDEIYDAMFRQGWQENLAWMAQEAEEADDPREELRRAAHRFFEFCTSDPVRYQLLFQRTIPGFEPSPESYAVAVAALDQMQSGFARAGVTDPDASDLATAVLTGLTSQQLANDPGGDRWRRLVDRAADMLMREIAPEAPAHRRRGARPPAASPPSRRTQ
jgi:AcrR family transcriptional regulator